ncbi:MAG: VWA domain-containing protein [Candidatus Xenobiia bacterium LiM19]
MKTAAIVVFVSVALLAASAFLYFGHKKKAVPEGPRIDIVFDLDCTGSMAGELKEFQDRVMDIMKRVRCGKPVPYVRFGLSGYRDKGDDYLVFKYDMTDNIEIFQSYVNGMRADGGGDLKESVNESLHTVLNEINWDKDPAAKKIVLLIGDAGPHTDYHNGIDYHTEIADAVKRGIRIYTIGCSGIENDGEKEFRAIADGTGGAFHYLTCRQNYTDKAGITSYRYKTGKNYYSVSGHPVEGDNWKIAIDKAIDNGTAESVEAPQALMPSGKMVTAPGTGQAPREAMESNIEEVCVKIIRREMEQMGIRFDTP